MYDYEYWQRELLAVPQLRYFVLDRPYDIGSVEEWSSAGGTGQKGNKKMQAIKRAISRRLNLPSISDDNLAENNAEDTDKKRNRNKSYSRDSGTMDVDVVSAEDSEDDEDSDQKRRKSADQQLSPKNPSGINGNMNYNSQNDHLEKKSADSPDSSLSLDQLQAKIEDLKRQKREYFNLFKKLINEGDKKPSVTPPASTPVLGGKTIGVVSSTSTPALPSLAKSPNQRYMDTDDNRTEQDSVAGSVVGSLSPVKVPRHHSPLFSMGPTSTTSSVAFRPTPGYSRLSPTTSIDKSLQPEDVEVPTIPAVKRPSFEQRTSAAGRETRFGLASSYYPSNSVYSKPSVTGSSATSLPGPSVSAQQPVATNRYHQNEERAYPPSSIRYNAGSSNSGPKIPDEYAEGPRDRYPTSTPLNSDYHPRHRSYQAQSTVPPERDRVSPAFDSFEKPPLNTGPLPPHSGRYRSGPNYPYPYSNYRQHPSAGGYDSQYSRYGGSGSSRPPSMLREYSRDSGRPPSQQGPPPTGNYSRSYTRPRPLPPPSSTTQPQ